MTKRKVVKRRIHTDQAVPASVGQPTVPASVGQPTQEPVHTVSTDPLDAIEQVPDDVVDRLLWRDAQHVLARHWPTDNGCDCCGANWPCMAQQLAERADVVSRLPRNGDRATRTALRRPQPHTR